MHGSDGGNALCIHIFMFLSVAVLRRYQGMGLGPVTSVIIFTDETDAPLPEYLAPIYDGMQLASPALVLNQTDYHIGCPHRFLLWFGRSEESGRQQLLCQYLATATPGYIWSLTLMRM